MEQMKISYIVMPFEESTYLVRCINSLYRQIGTEFEVILAENDFGERKKEIDEFLDGKPQVLRIPEEAESFKEKIDAAVTLVSPDSNYVMFIDVNTVVSPVAAQVILRCAVSDLILPSVAERNEEEFVLDVLDEVSLFKNIEKYPPQRFCFGRNLLEKFRTEYFEDQYAFSVFIFSVFAGDFVVNITNDVCMYTETFLEKASGEKDFEQIKKDSMQILDRLSYMGSIEAQVIIFDKLTFGFMKFMGAEEMDTRKSAFEALQALCAKTENHLLFKKLFELKVGCETDCFLALDFEEYNIYKNRIISSKESETTMAAIDIAKQEKMLRDMNTAIAVLQKDIVSMTKSNQLAITSLATTQQQAFSDPVIEIPRLYREGRLGFKVIWRSFCSWFAYKFRGNR